MTNQLLKKDLKFGDKKENSLIPQINKYFNCNVIKTKPFYEFDFIDKKLKLLFEVKGRRNDKNKYYDTMIGANKITEGFKMIKEGYKVYFVFDFTDFTSYYELSETSINKNWYRQGGRQDRGKDEIKKYCFIPNHLLINLIHSKNKFVSNYIIPSMTNQEPKTNDERPLSYSKRLFNYIKEANLKTYTINEIELFINDFSKMEYDKKREKTNEMPFGKYKYRKVKDVASFDKQYLNWLRKQDMLDNWTELKQEIDKYM